MRIVEIAEPVDYRVSQGPDTLSYIQRTNPRLIASKKIRYLDAREAYREVHIIAEVDGEIVGMAGVQKSPHEKNRLWIKFISVDPDYQGRGIAKQLLRHVYDYAAQEGLRMAPGSFTSDGERLRHLHDLWDKEYPSVAYARDHKGNYVDDDGKIVRMNEDVEWNENVRGGDVIVWVDAEKVRASWAKDRDFHFDSDLHSNAIKGRIPRFDKWIKQGIPVNPSEICLNNQGDIIFTNGRHRFVWMLQHGVERLPVAVPAEYVDRVKQLYG